MRLLDLFCGATPLGLNQWACERRDQSAHDMSDKESRTYDAGIAARFDERPYEHAMAYEPSQSLEIHRRLHRWWVSRDSDGKAESAACPVRRAAPPTYDCTHRSCQDSACGMPSLALCNQGPDNRVNSTADCWWSGRLTGIPYHTIGTTAASSPIPLRSTIDHEHDYAEAQQLSYKRMNNVFDGETWPRMTCDISRSSLDSSWPKYSTSRHVERYYGS